MKKILRCFKSTLFVTFSEREKRKLYEKCDEALCLQLKYNIEKTTELSKDLKIEYVYKKRFEETLNVKDDIKLNVDDKDIEELNNFGEDEKKRIIEHWKYISAPHFKVSSILMNDHMVKNTFPISITHKGIAHILQGGYTKQHKKEIRDKMYKVTTAWVAILVPTIALLLTNWDKVIDLYNLIFK